MPSFSVMPAMPKPWPSARSSSVRTALFLASVAEERNILPKKLPSFPFSSTPPPCLRLAMASALPKSMFLNAPSALTLKSVMVLLLLNG